MFIGPDCPGHPQMATHENVRMADGRVRMCKPHKHFTGATREQSMVVNYVGFMYVKNVL